MNIQYLGKYFDVLMIEKVNIYQWKKDVQVGS